MSLAGFEVEVDRGVGLETEEMTLNMGPQHPSTHGVLRFVVKADGEIMRRAIPDVGYLHRSIEKISEKVGYHGFMPYTDRVDYVAAMFCNQGWGMVTEKLADIEVPKRGEYCRIIAAELNRISSHLLSVGTMILDIGAITPFFHAFREREKINDLLEELCGARLTYNYMRIGGVAWDLPPGYEEKVLAFLAQLEPMLDEHTDLVTENTLFRGRCAKVATIPAKEAIDYNLWGPTCAPPAFATTFAATSRIRSTRSSSSTCRWEPVWPARSVTRSIATSSAFWRSARASRFCASASRRFPMDLSLPRCRASSNRPQATRTFASKVRAATWGGTR